jgi:molybdopterin-synthase adenylyltransferase
MALPEARPLVVDEADVQIEDPESRYDRQERVSWWDQDRLRLGRVLVVGAGALGNEVVKNLVLLGVGEIVVIDPDHVELSNLARCVLFRLEDEGNPKAEVLARRAVELNPDVSVSAIVGDVRSLGTGIAARADVIVGALDNREARLYCNRLAARTGRHWVDGAIEALTGIARVFHPPQCCYECTLTEADWQALAHRQSCRLLSRGDMEAGKVPTTATSSSVVGGIEAQEVVKLLHLGRPGVTPLNGALVFNGEANDTYPLTYPVDPDCFAHRYFESPIEVVLDDARFASMTPESLAKLAWPEAVASVASPVVVDLIDDHVIGWTCSGCGQVAPERRAASLIEWGEAVCPSCGEARQPRTISQVSIPGEHSAMTLGDIGVRYDEILPIRRGMEERFVWLSLADPRLPVTWRVHAGPDRQAIGEVHGG